MSKYPLKTKNSSTMDDAVTAYLQGVKRLGLNLHSFLLIQDDAVFAEYYAESFAAETPHELFSACKSMVSIAVGIAVSEGKLALTDCVTTFFSEKLPETVPASLQKLTVRDLLTMSSGQAEETWGKLKASPDGDWVKTFLALEPAYDPGERYVYSNSNSYLLSAIIQKLYGITLADFLYERVFDELGIQRRPWFTCPKGISQGTHGWRITMKEAALIGQLLLKKGSWNGRQLVPAAWLDQATAPQIFTETVFNETDRKLGYGYHFWVGQHNTFRCEGAYGQEIIVFPNENAVLVTFGGMRFGAEMQENLNLIWELIYPALSEDFPAQDAEIGGAFAFDKNDFGLEELQLFPGQSIGLTLGDALISVPFGEVTAFEYWFRGQPEAAAVQVCPLGRNAYEAHIRLLNSAYQITLLILAQTTGCRVVPLVSPEFNASEVKSSLIGKIKF